MSPRQLDHHCIVLCACLAMSGRVEKLVWSVVAEHGKVDRLIYMAYCIQTYKSYWAGGEYCRFEVDSSISDHPSVPQYSQVPVV